MNGKNDYITPGKQNHRIFPGAVWAESSAHMNGIVVLRLQTVKFPRMILCFDLRSFHFCFFISPLLVSVLFVFLLNLPFFFQCTCFQSLREALCLKLGSMTDYSDISYREFPKSLRKVQKLHIALGHKHFVLTSVPMYLFSYYFKIRRYD
jgi:hypothetical protein